MFTLALLRSLIHDLRKEAGGYNLYGVHVSTLSDCDGCHKEKKPTQLDYKAYTP